MNEKRFEYVTINGEDKTEALTRFISFYSLDRAAPGRYSLLLVIDLFVRFKLEILNPAKVIEEIDALEGIGAPSRMKLSAVFKCPPLKGLWHKHYLENAGQAVIKNLMKWRKRALPAAIQCVTDKGKADGRCEISIDGNQVIKEFVDGTWKQLVNKQALTGEWLVFAQHEGKNYYLCLATHDKALHEGIRNQIDRICCQEFPFLPKLLAS